ncbi:hypothetical protein MLD38_032035 [Melastoma candidum]|uniref:Uncharacterized protein n=1 Tax=Melastoma candidum TaxID=119954 RepID=A0ACB9MSM3_9MYRT|nr:hypothetical protein MLD38_032035 [Melastoma candidum]
MSPTVPVISPSTTPLSADLQNPLLVHTTITVRRLISFTAANSLSSRHLRLGDGHIFQRLLITSHAILTCPASHPDEFNPADPRVPTSFHPCLKTQRVHAPGTASAALHSPARNYILSSVSPCQTRTNPSQTIPVLRIPSMPPSCPAQRLGMLLTGSSYHADHNSTSRMATPIFRRSRSCRSECGSGDIPGRFHGSDHCPVSLELSESSLSSVASDSFWAAWYSGDAPLSGEIVDLRGKRRHDERDKAKDEDGEVERGSSVRYPVRTGAEDCSYYMRTGNCKFGSDCKFNHPVVRKNQDKAKEEEELRDRASRTECKYYLKTGGCKFGKACRYDHTRLKFSATPLLDLNFLGLPIRPGEKECPYYMRNGSCKFAANCRFNHPDPSAGPGDPSQEYLNGVSAPLSSGSQLSVASWSTPGSLNESAPYIPLMYSPTHGVSSHSNEWNRYQYQINIQGPSMHSAAAYVARSPITEGDCKFKSNCKYHHPKDRVLNSTTVVLSDKGLPLRPDQNICSYYSRYGICKFGPACKFDHPINLGSAQIGGREQLPSAGESMGGDGSRKGVVRNGEEDGGIEQPV